MNASIKLIGALMLLAWAFTWPTKAGATGYRCNSAYGTCIGQCEYAMSMCTLYCPKGGQKEYCYEDTVCWTDGTCIVNDECYYGPDNNCEQQCTNTVNSCAVG